MEVQAINTEDDTLELPGELPIEDITADGGGQLTKVGPPYDGTGGVVRGTERAIEEDHPGVFRAAARQVGSMFRGRTRRA